MTLFEARKIADACESVRLSLRHMQAIGAHMNDKFDNLDWLVLDDGIRPVMFVRERV